jgi:antitoxin component YwqK of YwqJK toxin-antitoxin module
MGNCFKFFSNSNSEIANDAVNLSNDAKIYVLRFDDIPTTNISYTTINGILEGEELLFDKSGKLMSKSFYVNGKLCGKKTDYNVFMYLNNKMIKVNKYEQFYENGILMSTNIIS